MTINRRFRIALLGAALAATALVAPTAAAADWAPQSEVGGPRPEIGGPRPEIGGPRPEIGGPRPEIGGPRPEIVGGDEVDPPGKYPFMVALVSHRGDAYNGQFCGASLIAPEWVLTAAHCVVGERASGIDVVIGRHDLNQNDGERIRAKAITVHPQYNDRTTTNDVALIELAQASTFAAVSLPADGTLEVTGTPATVTGWGDTQARPRFPSTLQQVIVPLVSDAKCAQAYGSDFKAAVMLCAGDFDRGGIDSCQGDSGGPLFVTTGDTWTQLGIVSWGNGCALRRNPGVYSRVSALQPWITQISGVEPGEGGGGGGGDGGDTTCAGREATITGTDDADVLVGTTGADVIVGLGGSDEIRGLSGADVICAGPGDDVVRGDAGDDEMYGGDGADILRGGGGNDRIYGEAGGDLVIGNGGADVLRGGDDRDVVRGGSDDDLMLGNGGNDRMAGGSGHDDILGGAGRDRATGGRGIDLCDAEVTRACEI